jgi:uncharacterized protein (TIGR03067 family)
VCWWLCFVVTACLGRSGAPALAGTWTPVSAELAGQDFPVANFRGATLQLTDSTYEFAGDTGTYAVLSAKEPAKMDIHGQTGPNAGRTIPAIFEVSDEQLTIGYQLGAGERPIEFTSTPGEQILIVQYRRTR